MTDRRRTERELRLVIDTIPAMSWSTLPDGSNDYCSKGWMEYTGMKPGTEFGYGWAEAFHPADRAAHLAKWCAATEKGEQFESEARIRSVGGQYRWFLTKGVPLRDESGRIVRWYGTNVDIEERKRAEEALRRSEAYLADAQRLTHTGSFVWDIRTGTALYLSDEWYRIYGFEPGNEHAWNERLKRIVPEDEAKWLAEVDRAIREKSDYELGKRIVLPNGETKYLHALGHPVLNSSGEVVQFMGTVQDITERKRGEEELRRRAQELQRSELYLSEGQRLAHMGSWAFDPAGFDYWSPELFRMYGLDPASKAPAFKEYLDCIHPEDREFMANLLKRILAEASLFDVTKRIVRPDGEVRYIRCVGAPVVENQSLKKFVGTAMDVTEHELLTQELHRREAYLTEAQRLSQTGSFGWRPDSGEIVWSDETFRIFDLEPTTKITTDLIVERTHPEDRADVGQVIERASREGTEFALEHRLLLPDESIKYLRVVGRPSTDEGRACEIVGAVTDITDQKRSEESLRESEAYLAEAQKLSQTGSWAWSPSTDIRYWSEECYRVLGFDSRDGVPRLEELVRRIHPDDQPAFRESAERVAREKVEVKVDYRIVHPGGAVRDIHSTGHPVLGPSGDLIEFTGTVIDVTERRRSEALLAGEKRLLEMVATGVPLKEILNTLCLIIEEQRPGMLASVLLLTPDGIHLNVVAGPNLPKEWKQEMETLPIGPCAGSCGTAAYRGTPVIVSDISIDPLWDVPEHRAAALKNGLRASWSNPVLSSKQKVLGTFCMYYREPRRPTSQDVELIELATHLARVAIERDRAEEALRASEQLARSHVEVMMRSLDVLATEVEPEKLIAELLRTIGQRLSASSVTLWLRNPPDDALRLHLMIENEQEVAPDLDHPYVKNPHAWKRNVQIVEMLFTKGPFACDDVEHDVRISAEYRDYLTNKGCQRFLALPMFVLGEVRGFISIQHVEPGAYRAEEIELAQALAHHVMMATHGAELAEQRRHAVLLKERTRMARDIHDTLAQGFTGVIVQLDTSIEALRDEEPEAAAKHILRARELARASLSEARRSVHALRPEALEKAAFPDALRATITNTAAGTSLLADFQLKGEPRQLQPDVEENLLRIGQEALTNALKHASATKFLALLSFDSDAVRLELRDNGKGFDTDSVNGGGIGLIGMRERADQIGATLAVTSKPGKGTRITAVSPHHSQETA